MKNKIVRGAWVISCSVSAIVCLSLISCNMDKFDDIKDMLELIPAEAISVSPTSLEIRKGETKQINLTIDPSNSNETIYWSSNDTDVATVNDSGLITGIDWGWTWVDAFTEINKVNSRVDTVKISAYVSTITGNGTAGYANGVGAAAAFNSPQSLASDGTYLYIADTNNNMIRKIDVSNNSVTTFSGTGSVGCFDSTANASTFNHPQGICSDGTNLYIADTSNNMIRKIVIATGVASTLAGQLTSGSLNATGTSAQFNQPYDVQYLGIYLYVADYGNHMIRRIAVSTGEVTTVAGSTTSGKLDGTGSSASFSLPSRIATNGTYLFVIDQNCSSIRKINIASGEVATLPYIFPPGFFAIAIYGESMIVVGDTEIYKQGISATSWSWNRIANDANSRGLSDGLGSAAKMNHPKGILSWNGKFYIADTENHAIRVLY